MAEGKRLTTLAKFAVLLFVLGCLVAAARLSGVSIPLPGLKMPKLGGGQPAVVPAGKAVTAPAGAKVQCRSSARLHRAI